MQTNQKNTIEMMQEYAATKGGKCISTIYEGADKKLIWQCAAGHEWASAPHETKNKNRWCSVCNGARHTIEGMRNLASKRGGRCLSEKYENQYTHLIWECASGHQWSAPSSSVYNKGAWCKECQKSTIETMHVFATNKGGKFLSKEYKGMNIKYLWSCSAGHEWEAKANNVCNAGTWCRECLRGNIKDMQDLALTKSGKCISSEYIRSNKKLVWECSSGHRWSATPESVKNKGTWCPECDRNSYSVGERITGEIFNLIFKEKFVKSSVFYILDKKRRKLQIDGYCKKLNIAFEYNGDQHYSANGKYSQSVVDEQKIRDKRKILYCAENNIKLIIVPQFKDLKNLSGCIDNIEFCIFWAGIVLPKWKRPISLPQIWAPLTRVFGTANLENLKGIAASKGGKLLSDTALFAQTPLLWECHLGHQWKARQYSIKNGHWCPYCVKKAKKTINDMHVLAKNRGGLFLSESFITVAEKYRWSCGSGHTFEMTANNVNSGHWCKFCKSAERKTRNEKTNFNGGVPDLFLSNGPQ